MAYTVDPLNALSPLDSDFPASNVAAELRQLKARLNTMQTAIDNLQFVPVGVILARTVSAVPAGYLAVPNAPTNISRTTYAALFAVLGTTWGAGDGSTTFGMPWVLDDDTLVQGAPGTLAEGTVGNHTHNLKDAYLLASISNGAAITGKIGITPSVFYSSNTGADVSNDALYYRDTTTDAMTAGARNRASGTKVKFIIKT